MFNLAGLLWFAMVCLSWAFAWDIGNGDLGRGTWIKIW